MLKNNICKICKSVSIRDTRSENILALECSPIGQHIFRCISCNFRFMEPSLNSSEIQAIYGESYFEDTTRNFSYSEQMIEELRSYEITANRFHKLLKSGNILDIGCATGEFLLAAKKAGFKTTGIDVSEYAVEKAKEKGLEASVTKFNELSKLNTLFDGIHISHVLEHLDDPVYAISEIKKHLKVGGILYIEVPNQFNSFLDRLSLINKSPKTFNVFSIHHRCFFSYRSIKSLLESNDFEIVSISTYRPEKRVFKFRRKVVLNSILYLSNFFKAGDIISIWAKVKD